MQKCKYTQDDNKIEAYLWIKQVCVHHSTLDVIQVSVVFQCSLQKSGLLTELSNVCTVIVGEHLVTQDSICNLRGTTYTFRFIQSAILFCNFTSSLGI